MYYILFILDSSAVLAGQGNRCFPYPVAFTIKTRQKIRRRTRNIVRILGSDYVTQWDGNGLSFGKAMTESVSCFATTTGSFIAPYLAVSGETRRRAISSACWLSCDSWPPPNWKILQKRTEFEKVMDIKWNATNSLYFLLVECYEWTWKIQRPFEIHLFDLLPLPILYRQEWWTFCNGLAVGVVESWLPTTIRCNCSWSIHTLY